MLFENIPRKLSCFSSTISWMRVKSRQTTEYTNFSVDNLIYSLKPYNTYQLLVSISFHVLFFTNWKLILRAYVSVASVSSCCWKAVTFRTCHGCNTALKAGNVVSRLVFFSSSEYLRFFADVFLWFLVYFQTWVILYHFWEVRIFKVFIFSLIQRLTEQG